MFKKHFAIWIFILLPIILNGCQTTQVSPNNQANPVPTPVADESFQVEPIKIGVLTIRSATVTHNQYASLAEYLEKEIEYPVRIIPVTQDEQFSLFESGELDFLFSNPIASVQIQRLFGSQILATLSKHDTGTQFGGVIIASQKSGIQTIEDLKGKKGTCVDQQTAAGGCIFQIQHLQQNGFDPHVDFAQFIETPSQDNIVLGVLNGTFDVGFIRTGQLERMQL